MGAALVIHSALGSDVKATIGEPPATFIAALLAGAPASRNWARAGSDFTRTRFSLFYFLTALAGTAVTSLVLTYLMQVYTALLRRNTVALDVDTWSDRPATRSNY